MSEEECGFDCLGVASAPQSQGRMSTALAAYAGGTVLGAVGGAILWRAHRVGGALLGFFLVGPMIGIGIAAAVLPKKV